jgi:MFS family permease
LLRNVNATLAPQLMAALALTPGQLGLLTSVYFFSFALVQLPVGMALDRWGPARVQWPMLLLAVLAALGFAGGQQFSQLLAARALLGFGLGGCFMAALKAFSLWVEPARLPACRAIWWRGWPRCCLGHAARALAVALCRLARRVHRAGPAGTGGALLLRWRAPRVAVDEGAPASSAALRLVLQDASFRQVLRLLLVPHMVYFGVQGLWLGRWLSDAGHYPEVQVGYLLYLAWRPSSSAPSSWAG